MIDILTAMSMVTGVLTSPVLILYSLRSYLRIKIEGVWVTLGLVAFAFGILLFWCSMLLYTISAGMAAMSVVLVIMYGLIFLFLKGGIPQFLYAVFYYFGIGGIAVSISNYIQVVSGLPTLVTSLVRIFLILFSCMVAFYVLHPLLILWENKGGVFWKAVWLIPFFLVILALFSGNVWTMKLGEHRLALLMARLVVLISLLATTRFLEHVLRQEQYYHSVVNWGKQLSVYGSIQDGVLSKLTTVWEETELKRRQLCEAVEQVKASGEADDFTGINLMLAASMNNIYENKNISWCENMALNALIGWYYEIAVEKAISVTLRLDIPEQLGVIKNVDLCRIIGNMLENAVEACLQVEPEKREINFSSIVAGRMLILVMDNSFDGNSYRKEGRYLSRKRENGLATGLSSIAAVAEGYHGGVSLKEEGKVFKISVRLNMRQK